MSARSDVAGLCERLERHTIVEPQGDGANKLYHYPDGARAARVIRQQAALIESLAHDREVMRGGVSDLAEVLRAAIKERDGPDRVKVEGVWYEGPLADIYIRTFGQITGILDGLLFEDRAALASLKGGAK